MARQRIGARARTRRPRRKCYSWMYYCEWTDAAGNHLYGSNHNVVIDSPDNYQLASYRARTESLAGMPESARRLVAEAANPTFRCRRVGEVDVVAGPC